MGVMTRSELRSLMVSIEHSASYMSMTPSVDITDVLGIHGIHRPTGRYEHPAGLIVAKGSSMTKAEDVHTRSQVEPVRENARPVNRRKLLGEIAGGLVLGHAAVPALAGEAQDPHIAWRAEERRIHDAMVAAFDAGGEERGSELNRQRWEFRSSIIDTPAATLAGLALRVRLVAENEEEGLTLGEDDFTALRSVADDLDRMAGRA